MTGPILALRAAILARAGADAALLALMGGALRLYDEPPRGAEPVHAAFGPVEARAASVDASPGHEQTAAIAVWSRPGSARAGLEAAERLASLLHEADLPLVGHRLVSLRVAAVETGRDEATGLARVTIRLRAVTETA